MSNKTGPEVGLPREYRVYPVEESKEFKKYLNSYIDVELIDE